MQLKYSVLQYCTTNARLTNSSLNTTNSTTYQGAIIHTGNFSLRFGLLWRRCLRCNNASHTLVNTQLCTVDTLKRMLDDGPILSVNKIGQQKLVAFVGLADFIVDIEHVLFSTTKSANFWYICNHGYCLLSEMNIFFCYLFWLLLHNVYFRSLDAEQNSASIIMWFAFCCCVFVKLADTVWSCKRKIGRMLWFNDLIGQFSRVTKPCPQTLGKLIDRLTTP